MMTPISYQVLLILDYFLSILLFVFSRKPFEQYFLHIEYLLFCHQFELGKNIPNLVLHQDLFDICLANSNHHLYCDQH